MRLTLDTDASTLTHPVQLCLVAIPMIVPSTYRKCTHFPSSKTVTSGYDSLTKKTEGLELGAVDKLLVGIFVGCDGREGKTCVHTLSRPSYLF